MPANPLGVALRGRRAGHHTLVWARPGLQAPENFTLTSPAFDHGAPIPDKHRGRLFGASISPALAWTQPPAGTAPEVVAGALWANLHGIAQLWGWGSLQLATGLTGPGPLLQAALDAHLGPER